MFSPPSPVRALPSQLSPVRLSPGDMVGFAVPRRSGGYVAGLGRSFMAVDWPTQMMTSLAVVDEGKPNNRLNDGKVDPIGRLLAGQLVFPGYRSIFCVAMVTLHFE